LTFDADGHTVTDRWTQKNGETKTSTFNYSIENNSLNLNGVDGDGENFNVTLSGEVTQTDTYIQFANGGRFFKTYAAAEDALGDSGTQTQTEITKTLLSQNPWYVIEYTENEAYCNGKFTFDMNYYLTGEWKEDGKVQSIRLNYSLEDGKLITVHDGKKETETLLSKDINSLTTEKVATNSETGEYLHTMNVKYFKNRVDAVSFGKDKGVNCNADLP